MDFYIFILFVVVLILLLSNTILDKQLRKKIACYFSFVLLFCVSAFRENTVGGDLQRYLPTYYGVASCTWSQIFTDYGTIWWASEPGFRVIQKAMSFISLSDYFYIFFTSAIVLSLVYYSIYKYSENVQISIFIFVAVMYTSSFNIIRASICIGLCLLAFTYIKRRLLLPYTLIILIAFSIQKTSLLFYPAYFLYNLNYRPKFIVCIMILNMGLSYFVKGSTIAGIVNNYTIIYELDSSSDLLNSQSVGLTAMGAFLTILTFYLMRFYKRLRKKDVLCEFYIVMLAVAAIIQYYSSIFQLLNRISYFYYCYLIFIIPYIHYLSKPSDSRRIFLFVIFILFFVLFFNGLNSDGNMIIPYKSYLVFN